ncbi:DNA sulfur modification protein DndD [Reichenbachiella sp.]|uniref:DNA sulfur modification protein DndD n=1 Tax=Reichenbachiella sp. TaxID=2184521 RepID=UPI00329733BC
MLIKEIELNNFRIYKGKNPVELLPEDDKNIIVISGKNGFGKTTFLMSLVWCLYGRQMEKVDELYKKEIEDKGNYGKYIGNSLNRLAESSGETRFSVSVTFTEVNISDITCKEVTITRLFDIKTGTRDELEILIDGQPNEVIQDLSIDNQDGGEIFIREFILPLEIAKFFFFDAEKIVSLAEVNSSEQRKALGTAYSQVLGIHKYEELKEQLLNIQDDYRKKAAKPSDRKAFIKVEAEIEQVEVDIEEANQEIERKNQIKTESKYESDQIQRTLIREGNYMSVEQVNELKNKEAELEKKIIDLQNGLKKLFDLIPFGLAGETLIDVSKQVTDERLRAQNEYKEEDIENKADQFLNDLDRVKNESNIVVDTKVRRFYEDKIRVLIKKHFYADITDLPAAFQPLHDFSDMQANELNGIIQNLQHSFKDDFKRINQEYSLAKSEIESIRRKLRDAEKNAADTYIADQRNKKQALDNQISEAEGEIDRLNQKLGSLRADLKTHKQRQEELRKRLDVSDDNKAKNEIIEEEINNLKKFITQFKEAKKKSLEEKIREGLNTLMHKKDFIHRVEVNISISGEDVEITLFTKVGGKEQKVDKGSLSMGERQMYSSALLSALVDESDINFPVFIDSPMQKFDQEHAENIIQHFYPSVSNQVVLFPLIHKELTEEEYELMKKGISKCYLINNLSNDSSTFIEVEPDALIKKYDELYVAAD